MVWFGLVWRGTMKYVYCSNLGVASCQGCSKGGTALYPQCLWLATMLTINKHHSILLYCMSECAYQSSSTPWVCISLALTKGVRQVLVSSLIVNDVLLAQSIFYLGRMNDGRLSDTALVLFFTRNITNLTPILSELGHKSHAGCG